MQLQLAPIRSHKLAEGRFVPGAGYTPTPETTAEMKAWFDGMGEQLVELGKPVVASGAVGSCPPESIELNGYSIVQAENLAGALAIAKECPHLTRNGGVEVGELGEVPPAT